MRWRFFSLEEINHVDGKKHAWEREWSYGFSQMRVGALLRRRGQAEVDRWYAEVGRAFHVDGVRTHERERARRAARRARLGCGAWSTQALADPTTADEVRADHEFVTARRRRGACRPWCSPTARRCSARSWPRPCSGAEAERLWDLVVGWTEFPHLYELQRPKRGDDLRQIATTFRPYLEARSWQSVANPTP